MRSLSAPRLHDLSDQLQGMGPVDRLQGQEIVSGSALLNMDTLRVMGMVIRRGSRWMLTLTPTEQGPDRGEVADEESAAESDSESSLPSATKPLGPRSRAVPPRHRSEMQEM